MARQVVAEKTRDWLVGSVKVGMNYVYNDIIPETGQIFYIGSGGADRVLYVGRKENKGWVNITDKHPNWIRVVVYETENRELAYDVEEYLLAINWGISRYLVNATIYGNRNHAEMAQLSKQKLGINVVCINTGEVFMCMSDAARWAGLVSADGIGNCCKGKQKYAGFFEDKPIRWCYLNGTDYTAGKTDEELLEIKHVGARPVVLVNNNYVFPSVKEAAQTYGIGTSSIISCCTGRYKYAGFNLNDEPLRWRYEDGEYLYSHVTDEEIKKQSKRPKPIICLNSNLRFASVAEAARYYKINKSNINSALLGQQLYSGIDISTNKPLRWKYEHGECHADGYSDEELLSINEKKPVFWINMGIEFPSIQDAIRQTGYTNISLCCRGKALYAGVKDGVPQRWKFSNGLDYSDGKSDEELLFQPRFKKVRCITTNEIFISTAEAASKYNIDASSLAKHCKGSNKTKYCGKHSFTNEKLVWEYINDFKESNNG